MKSGRSKQDSDLRCQSGPSAKNSVLFSGGDSSKNYGADQQTTADFGSSFWQIPYSSYVFVLEDKIQDRGLYLFTISYGSNAVDQRSGVGWFSGTNWDLRHLFAVFQCLILKYLMRGLLQPWTRSSIIPISKGRSVWRNKRPRKRTVSFEVDRLPTWSTNNSGSLEPIVLSRTYTDLFTIAVRNGDIQEFDSKWDGILLSMTKIPPDDILEGLYKLRIRESDKLKTVLELYDLETHQREVRTWLSQIESYGEKKYRAGNSK